MNQANRIYLAVDLGASSGRVLAGRLGNSGGVAEQLTLAEVHRFENGGIEIADRLQWNLLGLWQQIKLGLKKAHQEYGSSVVSVGVDTWGVDFGFLGEHDVLLGNPYHYRDRHTSGILEEAFKVCSREEIFASTGLQFMELNSLYQLLALQRDGSPILKNARSFLMIPDLFHWLLTGIKTNERTNASTTQFFNPLTKTWATDLLKRFGLPIEMLRQVSEPGTVIGKLRPRVAEETGLSAAQVVLPGTHDTASAVLAVPAESNSSKTDWCYISSGTWSLMGIESPNPIVNDRVRELNFTNEGGVGGTTRVLKNIAGLWLVQECRRIWAQTGQGLDWDALVQRAQSSPPLRSLVNPDHPSLVAPNDMPAAIRKLCSDTGEPIPADEGSLIRCALESLALRYRMALGWLEEIVGNRIHTIHIVGGGSQNQLLNRLAADACQRTVVAGPVEATALGNVLMQAVGLGDLASIADARALVRASFSVTQVHPNTASQAAWDEAYVRFTRLAK
jgi:rhamnulokinase